MVIRNDLVKIVQADREARIVPTRLERRTGKSLASLQAQTLLRVADVQAEGYVQGEKVKEIDRLAREAATGQAFLRRWVDTLAGGDPMMAAELMFFTDLARLGKGEIIADTIDTYCREGRR
jgi:hypothetical protein